ncbi:unnamed protein product [Cunninghamella echinulata]
MDKDQVKPYPRHLLPNLYGIDVIAAATLSVLVSPFIAIVDRFIIENMNGKLTLGKGIIFGARQFLTTPYQFIKSSQFRLVFGLYFSTYITANLVDTTAEYNNITTNQSSFIKFIATTAVNMSLCMYKDKSFARMFGNATTTTVAARSFPKMSYFLFALRDCLTVAASFNAPHYISHYLQQQSTYWETYPERSGMVSQLICPAFVQFFSTPIHLMALDLYNRPALHLSQRVQLIQKEYFKSALARIGRIGPAFGFGGIGNTWIRNHRSLYIESKTNTPQSI